MINTTTVVGNLTADPEVKYSQSGTAVATFTVALNRPKKPGEENAGADFPRVRCYGVLAESVGNSLRKGQTVILFGGWNTYSYTNQSGTKVYVTELKARAIGLALEMWEKREATGSGRSVVASGGVASFGEVLPDEDIPF